MLNTRNGNRLHILKNQASENQASEIKILNNVPLLQ